MILVFEKIPKRKDAHAHCVGAILEMASLTEDF